MKKAKKISVVDPTLPTRVVPTKQGDIRLCLDFGVLMDAEAELIAAGYPDTDLLYSIAVSKPSALRSFFVIASRRFQPELSVDEAKALVGLDNLRLISAAIGELWMESMPQPKPDAEDVAADPTPAVG